MSDPTSSSDQYHVVGEEDFLPTHDPYAISHGSYSRFDYHLTRPQEISYLSFEDDFETGWTSNRIDISQPSSSYEQRSPENSVATPRPTVARRASPWVYPNTVVTLDPPSGTAHSKEFASSRNLADTTAEARDEEMWSTNDHLPVFSPRVSRLHTVSSDPASTAEVATQSSMEEALQCFKQGCEARFTGQYRRGNLARHLRLKHGTEERVYHCEAEDCTKIYRRPDARLKHYLRHHPWLASSPVSRRLTSTQESRPAIASLSSKYHNPRIDSNATNTPILEQLPVESTDESIPILGNVSRSTCSEQPDRAEAAQDHTKQDIRDDERLESQQSDGCGSSCKFDSNSAVAHEHGNDQDEMDASGDIETGHLCQSSVFAGVEDESRPVSPLSSAQSEHFESAFEVHVGEESTYQARSPSIALPKSENHDHTAMTTQFRSLRLSDWISSFGIRSRGNSSEDTQTNRIFSNTSAEASSSVTRESTTHKRSLEDSPDDDKDRKRRKRRARKLLKIGEVAAEMYACPFPKRNPRQYTRCWDYVFDRERFPDLKQHLVRCHVIPFHCSRCGAEFLGEQRHAERDAHLRQQPQCKEKDLSGRWNGITEDQLFMIKKNKPRTMSEFDYWMHIYSILFAGKPLSGHPFHEDYKALEAQIMIRSIIDAVSNNIVPFIASQGISPVETDQNVLEQTIKNLIEAGVKTAFANAGIQETQLPNNRPLASLTAMETVEDLRGLAETAPIDKARSPEEVQVILPEAEQDRDRAANDNNHRTMNTNVTPIIDVEATYELPQGDGQANVLFDSLFVTPFNQGDRDLWSDFGLFSDIAEDTPPSD